MQEKSQITLRPEKIQFSSRSMKISDPDHGGYKIPYREIIHVSLMIPGREEGTCYEPEITDITGDMEGDLILCDSKCCKWRIHPELTGMTAGSLLENLTMHAPYILVGGG